MSVESPTNPWMGQNHFQRKDDAVNLPTHPNTKTERKGKQYTPWTSNGANRREIKKTGDENLSQLLVFEGFQLIFDLRSA